MNTLRPILLMVFLFCLSSTVQADAINELNNLTKTPEFEKMKATYEQCVLKKGVKFVKVSTPAEAINYAPTACKRELLVIKRFFLSGAFKAEILNALLESIKEGVEIDLINAVYDEKIAISR